MGRAAAAGRGVSWAADGRQASQRPPGRRLRLERLGVARARAILAGDLSAVDAAPGWPHADSLDGIAIEAAHAQSDDQTCFLAVLAETGQVVGEGGWKGGPDDTGEAEIGYGLAAPSRGQGLGTELVAQLTAWVLDQPGVTHVVAMVLPGNVASRRAVERNGFELDRADEPAGGTGGAGGAGGAGGMELRYVRRR